VTGVSSAECQGSNPQLPLPAIWLSTYALKRVADPAKLLISDFRRDRLTASDSRMRGEPSGAIVRLGGGAAEPEDDAPEDELLLELEPEPELLELEPEDELLEVEPPELELEDELVDVPPEEELETLSEASACASAPHAASRNVSDAMPASHELTIATRTLVSNVPIFRMRTLPRCESRTP